MYYLDHRYRKTLEYQLASCFKSGWESRDLVLVFEGKDHFSPLYYTVQSVNISAVSPVQDWGLGRHQPTLLYVGGNSRDQFTLLDIVEERESSVQFPFAVAKYGISKGESPVVNSHLASTLWRVFAVLLSAIFYTAISNREKSFLQNMERGRRERGDRERSISFKIIRGPLLLTW